MTTEFSPWRPQPGDLATLLLRLLQNCTPNLFIYGHWQGSSGVLGASPELLFYRRDQRVQTMALAGTLAKGKNGEPPQKGESLLQDPKELFEHQLVVEDLREKFALLETKLPPPSLELAVDGPAIIELPQLFHLQTRIEARHPSFAKQFEFDRELISVLHPTSALGLRSSSTPWRWLQGLRGHQQLGHFGAPFGLNLPSGYLCLVGIRNLEWNSEGAFLRAGCGVVARSQADREWAELRAKRDSVKALFKI
jgi:menaquinone-specific isochorismate synthase